MPASRQIYPLPRLVSEQGPSMGQKQRRAGLYLFERNPKGLWEEASPGLEGFYQSSPNHNRTAGKPWPTKTWHPTGSKARRSQLPCQ